MKVAASFLLRVEITVQVIRVSQNPARWILTWSNSRVKNFSCCYNPKALMKRSVSTPINYLYSALLIAGLLANLCAAPAVSFGRMAARSQQGLGSFADAAGGAQSHALTTAPRANSEVPGSKQKRVRHPALDFTALPPERFQLSAASLGQRALNYNQLVFCSSFLVRQRGRAPPISV